MELIVPNKEVEKRRFSAKLFASNGETRSVDALEYVGLTTMGQHNPVMRYELGSKNPKIMTTVIGI